jgi:DNA-binding GntR family transcriptional regulator
MATTEGLKVAFELRDTLATSIAKHVSEKIIRSELEPGERIQEETIAEELGVSRIPIREAMRILERDRLVYLIPRRGVWVSEMTDDFVDCLFDILGELYALGARRFVESSDDEDIRRVYGALEKMEGCAKKGDTLGYYEAIMGYSSAGVLGSKSPLLEQLLKELEASMRRAEYASVSVQVGDLKKNVGFFKRIAKYAQEGNGEMAAETVRAFFRHEKEFVMKNLREKPSRRSYV